MAAAVADTVLELYCGCVNVCVSIDNGNVRKANPSEFRTQFNSDYFQFFRDANVVENADGFKVTTKLDCLRGKLTRGEWIINSCINCSMITYAVCHQTPNTYLLSKQMLSKLQASSLVLSPNYSPVYEMLLLSSSSTSAPDVNGNNGSNVLSPSSHVHLQQLDQSTAKRLNEENELMIERIREFESEQQMQFSRFQSRARRDKEILRQVIVSFYGSRQKSSTEATEEFPQQRNSGAVRHTFTADISLLPLALNSQPISHHNRPKTQHGSLAMAQDAIFSMDEDSRIEVGVYEEATNDDEDDENGYGDGEGLDFESSSDGDTFLPLDSNKIYATSLPIAMPPMIKSPQSHPDALDNPELEGEMEKVDDPQWMAASIQALAMSVRGCDGTEMFGARPRPRLNTLD